MPFNAASFINKMSDKIDSRLAAPGQPQQQFNAQGYQQYPNANQQQYPNQQYANTNQQQYHPQQSWGQHGPQGSYSSSNSQGGAAPPLPSRNSGLPPPPPVVSPPPPQTTNAPATAAEEHQTATSPPPANDGQHPHPTPPLEQKMSTMSIQAPEYGYGEKQEHLTGQQEEYMSSVLGKNVPKAELHNPEGVIHCADISITIEGNLVPVIDVLLGGQMPIYFEHHILLWKDPSVAVQFSSMAGAFKRYFAGMAIFQTEASGPGNMSFSRDSVGQIVCLRLQPGQTIEVREHQFVLATANVSYSVTTFRGMSNMLFSRTGLLIDTFTCQGPGEGLVLLHGYGNVFERVLRQGEALDVEPGAWLWKDPSVDMQTVNCMQITGNQRPSKLFGASGGGAQSGGFMSKLEGAVGNLVSGGGSLFMNRLVGPGRAGMQSMTYHPPQVEGQAAAGGGNNIMGMMGSLGSGR